MKSKVLETLYNIRYTREEKGVADFILGRFAFMLLFGICFACSLGAWAQDRVAPFPLQEDAVSGQYPKRESRAVWLTTVKSLDWPKNKATSAAGREKQKQELCRMLDKLKAININTILLQARVRSTTIYRSDIEPWDMNLTGKYGQDPGYDPLQFAIEECHKRGMELHTWIVTFPVYKMDQAKQMGATGLHVKHPELVKKHGDQYYLDPGVPGTQDYLVKVCEEIVSKYDVDGIHFDYVRYPEKANTFADDDTYRKYGNGQNKAQWRRDNITRVVGAIYKRVKELKPWVRVSSSPVGKFKDVSRFSSKGWNCYDAVYQDAQGWLQKGIHDALYPMMYFKGDHFYPFAADWSEKTYGRMIAPGLAAYMLAPNEKNWPLSDVTNELHYIRALGLGGQCYFRAQNVTDNTKGLYDYLRETFYAYPALTPAATWLDSIAPSSPKNFKTEKLADGMVRLTWDACTDNIQAGGVRYNVYASRSYPVDATKAENLVAAALPEPSYTYNPAWTEKFGYHILVTAMDRFGNESEFEVLKSSGANFDADFAQKAARYGCVKPDAKGNVALPQNDAEYYAVTDLQGRILKTGKYASTINVAKLPAGWYCVRTLQKKGLSHVVLKFWKRS